MAGGRGVEEHDVAPRVSGGWLTKERCRGKAAFAIRHGRKKWFNRPFKTIKIIGRGLQKSTKGPYLWRRLGPRLRPQTRMRWRCVAGYPSSVVNPFYSPPFPSTGAWCEHVSMVFATPCQPLILPATGPRPVQQPPTGHAPDAGPGDGGVLAIAEVEEGGEYSIPRVPAAKPVTARACFLRRKTSSMRVVDGTYPRKKERKETLVLGRPCNTHSTHHSNTVQHTVQYTVQHIVQGRRLRRLLLSSTYLSSLKRRRRRSMRRYSSF